MRPRSAQEETLHGRAVSRPAGYWTHDEHLVETHFAVKDVTAGDAEATLQVERRQHLPMLDDLADVGSVLLDQRDDAVTERLAQLVPRTLTQSIGSVLQEDAHDVLAWRCERRVIHGGHRHFEQGTLRRTAVLGVVPGALDVL